MTTFKEAIKETLKEISAVRMPKIWTKGFKSVLFIVAGMVTIFILAELSQPYIGDWAYLVSLSAIIWEWFAIKVVSRWYD